MSKDYQPVKNNPYYLPQPVYRQVLWLIRDYDRMVEEYDNAIWDSPEPPDGQPRGSNIGNPTEREGAKRAALYERIHAIEQALLVIPESYRQAIWDNIQYYARYPEYYSRRTYSTWRCRFLYTVAEKLYLI